MNVYKKTYLQDLPKNAEVKDKNGVPTATWVGKGGKKKTAEVVVSESGTQKVRLNRKTYMVRFRGPDGIVVEKSTGCKSKEVALAKGTQLMPEAEKIHAGILTEEEIELARWRHAELEPEIINYRAYQEQKGNAPERIETTDGYLKEAASSCSWQTLGDLNPDRLRMHLEDLKATGTGAGTLNQRIATWVAFGNWLAGKRMQGNRPNWNGDRKLPKNPFDGFGKYDDRVDCRRKRRALTPQELEKLVEVAESRPLINARTFTSGPRKGEIGAKVSEKTEQKMKRLGRERALIYKTLVLTGLRKNELASLTVGQCHLNGGYPCIELHAADEKNRQGSQIPIRSDLADELRSWIADLAVEAGFKNRTSCDSGECGYSGESVSSISDKVLFYVPSGLVKILNRDMGMAGIPKVDDRGYTVDVHALRHSFGTLMSASNVAPRVAQAAMRHSDISLTMNVYTDPRQLQIRSAVESLPVFVDADYESETDEVVESGAENMFPKVLPDSCCEGEIETIVSEFDDKEGETEEAVEGEKPRENVVSPELSLVGMTGFEPATSTPPELHWKSAKPSMPYFIG